MKKNKKKKASKENEAVLEQGEGAVATSEEAQGADNTESSGEVSAEAQVESAVSEAKSDEQKSDEQKPDDKKSDEQPKEAESKSDKPEEKKPRKKEPKPESKPEKKPSAEEKQKDKPEKPREEFVERKITESEKQRLRERFKFDWEIEEDLKEALDEDAADLTEPDEYSVPATVSRNVSFSHAAQTVFGLFVLVFTIIGIIATGFKIAEVIENSKDTSEREEYFEDFLMPLVASDAPIFDGASSLNEDVVIAAACWDIIFNPSVYYEYSGGNYKVSYIDIDRRINKLFGPGLSYTHKTVGDVEISFDFDENTGMYTIPAFPRSPAYYPEVTSFVENNGVIEVTVDYKLPITYWIDSIDSVEKSMIYTLVPTDSDYNVVAIRIGEISVSEAI